MTTIIISIIISVLLGVTSPITSLGLNLPAQKSLSEVNPLESLEKITAPLNNLLGGLMRYINIKPWLPKSTLESISGFEGTLDSIDNISLEQALRMVKSGFILVANILVTVLEISLKILRGVLGLIR